MLIGSSAIGTGVDGLQAVCDTLIFNVLPWTAAQYDQIKGRVYRQGQRRDVTVVLPLTFATVGGERWSWCESKLQRLAFKRSIADAAVDGVVPDGPPPLAGAGAEGPARVAQAAGRGRGGDDQPAAAAHPAAAGRRRRGRAARVRYGDFSLMNQRINGARSEATHERFRAHPDEWGEYHARYRERRRGGRWCPSRS